MFRQWVSLGALLLLSIPLLGNADTFTPVKLTPKPFSWIVDPYAARIFVTYEGTTPDTTSLEVIRQGQREYTLSIPAANFELIARNQPAHLILGSGKVGNEQVLVVVHYDSQAVTALYKHPALSKDEELYGADLDSSGRVVTMAVQWAHGSGDTPATVNLRFFEPGSQTILTLPNPEHSPYVSPSDVKYLKSGKLLLMWDDQWQRVDSIQGIEHTFHFDHYESEYPYLSEQSFFRLSDGTLATHIFTDNNFVGFVDNGTESDGALTSLSIEDELDAQTLFFGASAGLVGTPNSNGPQVPLISDTSAIKCSTKAEYGVSDAYSEIYPIQLLSNKDLFVADVQEARKHADGLYLFERHKGGPSRPYCLRMTIETVGACKSKLTFDRYGREIFSVPEESNEFKCDFLVKFTPRIKKRVGSMRFFLYPRSEGRTLSSDKEGNLRFSATVRNACGYGLSITGNKRHRLFGSISQRIYSTGNCV